MSNVSSKRRPVNLSLLTLILLCLAFPFTAVSCETSVTSVSAEYAGWDMAFGGNPTVKVAGQADEPRFTDESTIPAQPLMIVAVLIVIAGLVLLSRSQSGPGLGVVVGALAAFFLIVNQISVHNLLAFMIEKEGGKGRDASDLAGTRFGFWLALLLALAVTAYNSIVLVMRSRAKPAFPRVPPMH
jgi:hypothetical protein